MDAWVEESVRTEEERIIRDTLLAFARPASIEDVRIEFGEDHSGHPAVWVWLIVPDSLALDSPEWDAAYMYCDAVDTALVQRRLTHWPYVSLRMRPQISA